MKVSLFITCLSDAIYPASGGSDGPAACKVWRAA